MNKEKQKDSKKGLREDSLRFSRLLYNPSCVYSKPVAGFNIQPLTIIDGIPLCSHTLIEKLTISSELHRTSKLILDASKKPLVMCPKCFGISGYAHQCVFRPETEVVKKMRDRDTFYEDIMIEFFDPYFKHRQTDSEFELISGELKDFWCSYLESREQAEEAATTDEEVAAIWEKDTTMKQAITMNMSYTEKHGAPQGINSEAHEDRRNSQRAKKLMALRRGKYKGKQGGLSNSLGCYPVTLNFKLLAHAQKMTRSTDNPSYVETALALQFIYNAKDKTITVAPHVDVIVRIPEADYALPHPTLQSPILKKNRYHKLYRRAVSDYYNGRYNGHVLDRKTRLPFVPPLTFDDDGFDIGSLFR